MCPDKTSLCPTPTHVSREAIVEQAREWKDVRWKHQGRDRHTGVDCVGLVAKVAHELGISDYDQTNYQRNTHDNDFVKHFAKNMKSKRVFLREVGDVLLFRDKIFSCHAAILSHKHGVEHIIHAYAKHRKVVEEPLTDAWLEKVYPFCFEYYRE